MLPNQLTRELFASYPPEARELAMSSIAVLQKIPIGFLLSLLRELVEYDEKFPAEKSGIRRELSYLGSLDAAHFADTFAGFSKLNLSEITRTDRWVTRPMQTTEDLSAYLWSTGQMDAFRAAAIAYGEKTRMALAPPPPAVAHLGIAVIGQGVPSYEGELYSLLRKHGTYFTEVTPEGGLDFLTSAVESRAKTHPSPYAHWYIDGGEALNHSSQVTAVSYNSLAPTRDALLAKIQHEVSKPGMGPEQLRDFLVRLLPADLGMTGDAVLDRFSLKVLTEGSGTQIFSTTFAQWTAREVLRRASPLTVLVRFSPRQRQRPMNELLASNQTPIEFDPLGSLIDADMAAYYQWINQQHLPGADTSSFVVWFEGHRQALAIGPTLPRGVESKSAINLDALVRLATS